MAEENELVGWYVGTDATVDFECLVKTAAGVLTQTPKDLTGMALVLDIRSKDLSSTVMLTSTATIVGTYNAVRATNTQRARFTLTDEQLAATIFTGDDRARRHSVKRTDPGSETILNAADVTVTRVTQT